MWRNSFAWRKILSELWCEIRVGMMSELIDKEKLLDTIKPIVGMWNDGDFWINYQRVLDIIESAEPEWKWILVSEALPEKKEMVLITNNKGHVRCGQYQGTFDDKNYRWWWKHNTLEEVLAWMPLPEPWRCEK